MAWTFAEARTAWHQWLNFMMHGVHHDHSNDSRRLVMPPLVSFPLAALFFGLFWLLFGLDLAPAFFAGFVGGYLCYDTLHFAIHHFPPRGSLLRFMKRHHLRHHFVHSGLNCGVSSPVWDFVFRTLGSNPSPPPPGRQS